MEKIIKIRPPGMPNYVFYDVPPGLRQDGFNSGPKMDIAEFSESEAEEYAELMRVTFLDHYKKRKLNDENNQPAHG